MQEPVKGYWGDPDNNASADPTRPCSRCFPESGGAQYIHAQKEIFFEELAEEYRMCLRLSFRGSRV